MSVCYIVYEKTLHELDAGLFIIVDSKKVN